MQMSPAIEQRPREPEGWRRGRPVEDPSKTKRWGFVTAKPSEFLVHCRRGVVLPSSGQGATCFKWPWDSVSVVPTSFQRISFVADQVTLERVGVAITGLAVYRVADPLLAYRVLNFSYPERAQEKLEQTLTEMLIGATRRLVANLTVDACLQERKAALAEQLLHEISPVIAGQGRPDDRSDRGWGVVLDTVEIQEVKVLSQAVFADMQAPYRAALERRAREAEIERDAAVAERTDAVKRQQLERASADQARALERASADQLLALELALREQQARVADAIRRRELAVEQARSQIAAHEHELQARALHEQLERVAWQAKLERQAAEAELDATIGRRNAEVALAAAEAELRSAAAQAKLLTAKQLPALAGAVGAKFGEVKVTQIGGDNPFATVAAAVNSVLELVREG
jgi:hypothetical protein